MTIALDSLTLSADSLKTWDACHQQFQWKVVNRLHWPSDTRNFVLGTSIHKLIDCHARGMDVTPLLAHASDDIKATWHILLKHPATQWPVVASEWGFELPVTLPDTPVWVTGRIDRVAWHQNHLWIIDWKTGTAAPRRPEHAWQTGLYALALWKAWATLPTGPWTRQPPTRITVAYVAVNAAETKQLTVTFTADEIAWWENRLTATVVQIAQTQTIEPTDPCPDKWCVFKPMCPITRPI